MKLQSFAKINLYLRILGRRSDGFHEVETLMAPLDLVDRMDFSVARDIGMTCDDPFLPTGETNLVVRAARALAEKFRVRKGARIVLQKRIPIGGGLGGGSSNAATTLLALSRLWKLDVPQSELSALAAELGSDVAFFLQRRPAIGTGRGERIWPVSDVGALAGAWILLVNPGFGVATNWAYRNSGAPRLRVSPPASCPGNLTLPGNLTMIAKLLHNSLEEPVFSKFPLLAMIKARLRYHGAVGAAMSGSGATMFAIVRSPAEGNQISNAMKSEFGAQLWTLVTRCPVV